MHNTVSKVLKTYCFSHSAFWSTCQWGAIAPPLATLLLDSVITVPAMRDEFSSTTQRQRSSPCIGKLQTHHELKKQDKAKSKFKAMLIVFFYVKGVVVFIFFFLKLRMKRCLDSKGEYIKGGTK